MLHALVDRPSQQRLGLREARVVVRVERHVEPEAAQPAQAYDGVERRAGAPALQPRDGGLRGSGPLRQLALGQVGTPPRLAYEIRTDHQPGTADTL